MKTTLDLPDELLIEAKKRQPNKDDLFALWLKKV